MTERHLSRSKVFEFAMLTWPCTNSVRVSIHLSTLARAGRGSSLFASLFPSLH